MEKEDNELLLKDLCTRLPYGVVCNTPKGDGHLCSINQTIFGTEYGVNIKATERDYFNDKEVCIKPYLRPMSSMTEEEKEELRLTYSFLYSNYPFDNEEEDGEEEEDSIEGHYEPSVETFDWYNKKMFDYRGLIEKGLAIAVTEENNPYIVFKK